MDDGQDSGHREINPKSRSAQHENIQVIDDAENCAYSIFAATDREFALISGEGRSIAFAGEVIRKVGSKRWNEVSSKVWKRGIKREVIGIYRTVFHKLGFKKRYHPNRRETDLDAADAR